MQSLKSNALEPTRSELAGLTRLQTAVRLLPIYGLPILALLLAVFFSILLPDSFPTELNVRSILSDKGIIALLSLGAMLPMMAGRIDLTIGFGIVLWHILAISLQVWFHVPWPLAMLLVMLCSGVAGLINGLLVEVAQIDSFIATLGTGTIFYALALWLSGGRQVMGHLDPGFIDINALAPLGIPMPAVYVILLGLGLWVMTERLPLGRHLYAIGANEKAAALNGIPVRTYVIGVFVGSGLVAGFHRLRAGIQAADWSGQRGPRLSAAGVGRRVPRHHHHQAGPGQCPRHHRRSADPGDRYLGHSAAWRRILRRANVQRHHPDHCHRDGRLRAAAPVGDGDKSGEAATPAR